MKIVSPYLVREGENGRGGVIWPMKVVDIRCHVYVVKMQRMLLLTLGKMLGLGRGRWAVSQKHTLIQTLFGLKPLPLSRNSNSSKCHIFP